jgi:hypothetical protein
VDDVDDTRLRRVGHSDSSLFFKSTRALTRWRSNLRIQRLAISAIGTALR